MGDTRLVRATDIRDRVNLELRNQHKVQFEDPEILAYINKWLEFTHQYLIESDSELVRTGMGQVTITKDKEGEAFSMSGAGIGDLLVPYRVWIPGNEPMDMVPEMEKQPYLIDKELGVDNTSVPVDFFIEGDNIAFLPFPDKDYIVKVKYYPDFEPLSVITETMPFRNLFNLQIEEGAKILAKNRENYGTSVDAALMEIFKERAKALAGMREKRQLQFTSFNPSGGYSG